MKQTVEIDTSGGATVDFKLSTIKSRLAELKESLDNSIENYAEILNSIHSTLNKDFEVVSLLTPDEIGILVQGLAKHADIELAPPVKVPRIGTGRAKKVPISLDDL